MILTVYEDVDHVFDALAAGATGYLLKQTPRGELLDSIKEVHAGGSPMTSNIARRVVQAFHREVPGGGLSREKLSQRVAGSGNGLRAGGLQGNHERISV